MKLNRITKQKEILEKEISSTDNMFTAEKIYDKVKDKNIGIATVYRFLNEKKKKSELHSYICERKTVYSKNKNNHCHFVCKVCNKSIHFNIDKIDFMKKNIPGDICHFQIDVTGTCKNCLNKIKQK